MNCEEYLKFRAEPHCAECEERLCSDCNTALHSKGIRKSHNRVLGRQCPSGILNNCLFPHLPTDPIPPTLRTPDTVVFWDIVSCPVAALADLPKAMNGIKFQLTSAKILCIFGELPLNWRDAVVLTGATLGLEIILKKGDDFVSAFTLATGKKLVVLTRDEEVLDVLRGMWSESATCVSFSLFPVLPVSVNDPYFQYFSRKLGPHTHESLVRSFLEESCSGRISLQKALFPDKGAEELVAAGFLYSSKREFRSKTVEYLSLQLGFINLRTLKWVLRSLKFDEIMPTERSIQSRIKEAFGLKLSPEEWESLSLACSTTGAFRISSYTELSTGSTGKLIYPLEEEWTGLDQYIRDSDSLNMTQTAEWAVFISYLSNHFTVEGKKTNEAQAIPGGRYGCAQFLKHCGPKVLVDCSLGRLVYMVQLAINANLFKYHKTLLVWKPEECGKSAPSKRSSARKVILEILKEFERGVSLAKLPVLLKRRKFRLDLTSLGFVKLKDFLNTLPEVTIRLKSENHPFAVLSKENKENDCSSGNVGLKSSKNSSVMSLLESTEDEIYEELEEISRRMIEEILQDEDF